MTFILERRLAQAHRMLTDPRFAEHRIKTIVFDAGFGHLSHFWSAFRSRFGASPAEVRGARPAGAGGRGARKRSARRASSSEVDKGSCFPVRRVKERLSFAGIGEPPAGQVALTYAGRATGTITRRRPPDRYPALALATADQKVLA
jgi:hypothetical protein